MHTWLRGTCSGLLALAVACGGDGGGPAPEPDATAEVGEELSGGATTVFDISRNAFALPARNLSEERRGTFFVGNALFNRNWVTAPSSTSDLDGLGPTFNASSCAACHFKDGRGRPPLEPDEKTLSILFRLSVPGTTETGGPVGDPVYGTQLNPQGIVGVPPEGDVAIQRTLEPGSYGDGTPYALERPTYALVDLNLGPAHPDLKVSPRVAPAMVGLGLLEALSDQDLLARSDPEDVDGDGISGRPNWVWDAMRGERRMGRFGWKANQPSLAQQNAEAFLGDVGITSDSFPLENCPQAQSACREAPTGNGPQIDARRLNQMLFYVQTLAVPARRDVGDPLVLRGKQRFSDIGCASCHTPKLRTGTLDGVPELSQQTIYPYSDLLLHDMGEALSDGRSDFEAEGREWRTPPLWGIGLVPTVNRHTRFLHDGRARSFEEAILWHGGEARAARDHFAGLPAEERAALIRFLESL